MKKRLLATFLALFLVLGLLPGTAWAADSVVTTAEDFLAALESGAANITLGADIELVEAATITSSLVLDLNGHAIYHSSTENWTPTEEPWKFYDENGNETYRTPTVIIRAEGADVTIKNGDIMTDRDNHSGTSYVDCAAAIETGSVSFDHVKFSSIGGNPAIMALHKANVTSITNCELNGRLLIDASKAQNEEVRIGSIENCVISVPASASDNGDAPLSIFGNGVIGKIFKTDFNAENERGILVIGGNIGSMESCNITVSNGEDWNAGVYIADGAIDSMTNCNITLKDGESQQGIFLNPHEDWYEENEYYGYPTCNASIGTISGCTVTVTAKYAQAVNVNGGKIDRISGCTLNISENGTGISVNDGEIGTVSECTIKADSKYDCAMNVAVDKNYEEEFGVQAAPRINTVNDCETNGIFVVHGGGEIGEILGTSMTAVHVNGSKIGTIRGCTITGEDDETVTIGGDAEDWHEGNPGYIGTIDNCKISSNTPRTIHMALGTIKEITGNTITNTCTVNENGDPDGVGITTDGFEENDDSTKIEIGLLRGNTITANVRAVETSRNTVVKRLGSGNRMTANGDAEAAAFWGRLEQIHVQGNWTEEPNEYGHFLCTTADGWALVLDAGANNGGHPAYTPDPDSVKEDDDATSYVSIPRFTGGEVVPSTRNAAPGDRVTLHTKPNSSYELDSITATTQQGRAIALQSLGNGSYIFTMPNSRVTVNAVFTKIPDTTTTTTTPAAPVDGEPFTGLGTPGISGIVLNPSPMPFTDVLPKDWFYDNVDYVWKHYLMSGVSDTQFAPNTTTSRAMIWTILARMNNVRTEVNPGANWYERGMLWAMEQGVTDGTSPMSDITREQLATMLWRNAGSPGAPADLSRFSDSGSVSAYASGAVHWAVANGILNGSDGKLDPQGTATRAQVAAMVMRYGERIGA